MLIFDIKRVVEQVGRDKGIDRDVLISALEEALKSAARKKFGNKIDIETHYNDQTGEIEVFQFKDVTLEVTDPDIQLSLEDGRQLDPECEVGDSLGTKLDTTTFGRIAAQSAKQVIIQKMKDAERDAVYNSFISRKGEIINGIVQRFDRGDTIVNLGHTEGALQVREQVPKENYRRGDRIRDYIKDVLHESRGPQIILSRTHPNFLINLFKTEVPEISEGIVSIMGAAREPGVRAKIAVSSNDSDIDPVGACVGMKGSRVQNVVQELRGEKIDIIPWHVDAAKFVCNALAPAEISRVIIDEENQSMEVIVPDDFLSIAIGKRGQNVRLASKLTGWHLDVKSESSYSEMMQNAYNSLVALPNVSIGLADALYEKGFYSAEELCSAAVEDLMQIRDIDEEFALKLIASAEEAEAQKEAAEALEAEQLEEQGNAVADEDAEVSATEPETDPDDEEDAIVSPAEEASDSEPATKATAAKTEPEADPDAEEDATISQADAAADETVAEADVTPVPKDDSQEALETAEKQTDSLKDSPDA